MALVNLLGKVKRRGLGSAPPKAFAPEYNSFPVLRRNRFAYIGKRLRVRGKARHPVVLAYSSGCWLRLPWASSPDRAKNSPFPSVTMVGYQRPVRIDGAWVH